MNKIISKRARHFTQDNTSVILSVSHLMNQSLYQIVSQLVIPPHFSDLVGL